MEWALLGYKEFPFSVNPISADTIELFTGYKDEIKELALHHLLTI